jgi:hypothetical protein
VAGANVVEDVDGVGPGACVVVEATRELVDVGTLDGLRAVWFWQPAVPITATATPIASAIGVRPLGLTIVSLIVTPKDQSTLYR